ncbi:hypothetical protein LguiA_012204 [Lonicera macranthoides]
MECKSETATITSTSPPLSRSPSPPHYHSNPTVVISPCAACKILRRRCADTCVLAPYFPPNDPIKFTTAHRVFGASNIIKFLQELPESQKADAVNSMVYEANARLRDPVYGCAGVVCQLQEQVNNLQAQLAKAKAELVNIQCQQSNLMSLICMETTESPQPSPPQNCLVENFGAGSLNFQNNSNFFVNCSTSGSLCESLWT